MSLLVWLAGMVLTSLGQAEQTPWWEAETALESGGALVLSRKPWWREAVRLKPPEQLIVRSSLPGGGSMIVRRARLVRQGRELQAIVWILDDDGDLGPNDRDGDRNSDCYVVDYDADGLADRMVDYIDTDGDGRPDEMDLRYFQHGRLRRAFFGVDLDRDGKMFDVANYEYSLNFFASDPYGDNMIYENEYDPQRNEWVPSGECPFAFYDTDGDSESEIAIRASAAPLELDPWNPFDMDYANAIFFSTLPFTERQRWPGLVNLRYSVDIDGLSGPARRLHYDMGFNMIGRLPYEFPDMDRFCALRRPPKTTYVVPYGRLRELADAYPAEQTGFSWREYGDDGVSLGAAPHAAEDRRWEGVFWVWNRRFMHNTGGPTQLWNVRREFCPNPTEKRELYFSRADRRIHLKGATDGWICVGRLGNRQEWGEIRMFDTNGDGLFDRWETHLRAEHAPARVSTVLDAGIRPLPSDWDELQQLYTRELLPEAMEANQKLMAAMRSVEAFRVPKAWNQALAAATCDSERLYVLSVMREAQYLDLRDALAARSAVRLASVPNADLRYSLPQLRASVAAWDYARALSRLDAAYAEGRYDDAAAILEEFKKNR